MNGMGSKWSNSWLYVGENGSGTLNISGGGEVSVDYTAQVASHSGSTGSINFGIGGGTLTTGTLMASPSQLTGSGTINTQGLVSDVDLVFDSNHEPNQSIWLNNIRVNLAQNIHGVLGAGYNGAGSIVIRDGLNISSRSGYIGLNSGSVGRVTVEGTNSRWDLTFGLTIGQGGKGTLNIIGGGTVAVRPSVILRSQSLLAIDVGRGSSLIVDNGNGFVTNIMGKIRFSAQVRQPMLSILP